MQGDSGDKAEMQDREVISRTSLKYGQSYRALLSPLAYIPVGNAK